MDDTEVHVIEVVDTVSQIVTHTTPAGFGYGPFDSDLVPAIIEAQRREATGHLDAAARELRDLGVQKVETSIEEGRPGEVIVEVATKGGFDLIVMGTPGRSGLFRTFLGSVAEHVVRHVRDIPVLLVHASSEEN